MYSCQRVCFKAFAAVAAAVCVMFACFHTSEVVILVFKTSFFKDRLDLLLNWRGVRKGDEPSMFFWPDLISKIGEVSGKGWV